jgi:hypothetical protein
LLLHRSDTLTGGELSLALFHTLTQRLLFCDGALRFDVSSLQASRT